MDIDFKDDKLRQLYEGEKVKDKNYRFQPALIKQFIKTVGKLVVAERIEHLTQFNSLHYERLKGDRKGGSSVRINDQYRLIFEEIANDADPPQIVLLRIDEISKHYE